MKMRREKIIGSSRLALGRNILLALVLTMVCGLWSVVYGQSAAELYSTANVHYKNNQFGQAVASYEKILAQGYGTAEVYYNLGNSYYKLNNIGKAVLNFERAHKLAPEDEDIAHNLKLAQLKAVDRIVPVPQLGITTAWNNFVCSQSSKGWAVYALVFVWLTLIAFAVYLFLSKKGFLLAIGSLFLLLSISSFSLALKQNRAEENSDTAVLLVSNVNVKSAPDANGTDLFTIHEGVKFQILDHVGPWNKIRLADGKVGWIEKNLFEKI